MKVIFCINFKWLVLQHKLFSLPIAAWNSNKTNTGFVDLKKYKEIFYALKYHNNLSEFESDLHYLNRYRVHLIVDPH